MYNSLVNSITNYVRAWIDKPVQPNILPVLNKRIEDATNLNLNDSTFLQVNNFVKLAF